MTEPKPPKTQSKQPKTFTALIVLIIVAAVLGVWWLSHRDAAVKGFAESFIHEMDKGNLAAATARCTADVDTAEMKRLSDRMTREWGEIQHLDLTTRHVSSDRIDVAGQLEYQSDLRKAFTATILLQKDGSMKISSYRFE